MPVKQSRPIYYIFNAKNTMLNRVQSSQYRIINVHFPIEAHRKCGSPVKMGCS